MIKILIAVVLLALVVGSVVYIVEKDEITDDVVEMPVENDEPLVDLKSEKPTVISANVLDLSKQGFEKAPSYIFDKTEIEELDLSNNNIGGSLQAEVRQLQNLKTLDLSNNVFTGVPAEVGQLKNLEVLNLSNNKLTGLPQELGNLSNLKVLNLKGNAYSVADLNIIKQGLSSSVVIEVD